MHKNNSSIRDMALKYGLGILGIFIFLILWQMVGYVFSSGYAGKQFLAFLPIPAIRALCLLILDDHFWGSVLVSIYRIFVGIGIGFSIGFPFGLLIGFYRSFHRISNFSIQFIRMISPLSWMPIAIIVFPDFDSAIYFLITIVAIWPILLNTTQGVLNVAPNWMRMAQNQGANNYHLLTRVILPASIPHIHVGLRLALGSAWIVLIPAEYLGVTSGLGYLINDARDTMEYDRLMAIIIAIGIIGYVIDRIFQFIPKRFDWRLQE